MFATCGTINLVGHKRAHNKAFVDDAGLEGTSVFIACSSGQSCIRKPESSLHASGKDADQMADLAGASTFAGASESVAKLLDEAALSEEAKAEFDRFMVANPTKNTSALFAEVRELNEFVLSGECEPASITLGDAISVNARKQQ